MAKTKKPTAKELEQKITELTEALQRERADSINLRHRHDQEIANLRKAVKAAAIEDLLPVIDNFERALSHTPKDLENNDYVKGVKGIVKQFEDTLENMGVKKIKTVGEKFDPNIHEAVSMDGEGGKEIVSEELQAGYMVGDQVIRHAMVKVQNK